LLFAQDRYLVAQRGRGVTLAGVAQQTNCRQRTIHSRMGERCVVGRQGCRNEGIGCLELCGRSVQITPIEQLQTAIEVRASFRLGRCVLGVADGRPRQDEPTTSKCRATPAHRAATAKRARRNRARRNRARRNRARRSRALSLHTD